MKQGTPTFIIAEAGVNHNGSLALARDLVSAAKDAGADAVKFQTFRAASLVSPGAKKAAYQKRTTDARETQYEMLSRLELSNRAFGVLADWAARCGIAFMSSPFDLAAARFLARLGVASLKIPSGEVTNIPFLKGIGALGCPVILSTGMSYLGEVEHALRTLQLSGAQSVALLHCVSQYPAPPADTNLRAMATMRQAFQVPVGFSDHSLGIALPIAAVALGAEIIEKHLTLDTSLEGPDHAASLMPKDFAAMVAGIRETEVALGDGRKVPAPCEQDTRAVARRSLVVSRDIPAGTVLEKKDLLALRPGTGLPPTELPRIIGRRTARKVKAGDVLRELDLV